MLSTQPAPTLQNSGGMYISSYRLLTSGMVLTRVLGGNLGASHLYRPVCRGGEWGDRERERDLERDREERLWTFAGERDRPRLGGGLRGLQYQHIHKSCNIYTTLDACPCCFCCHNSQLCVLLSCHRCGDVQCWAGRQGAVLYVSCLYCVALRLYQDDHVHADIPACFTARVTFTPYFAVGNNLIAWHCSVCITGSIIAH